MKRCPHCGVQDHDEAILCKSCTRSFASAPAAPARAQTKRKVPVFRLLFVMLLLAGVIFANRYPDMVDELMARLQDQMAEPAPAEADGTPPPPAESNPVTPLQPPDQPPPGDVPSKEESPPPAVVESAPPATAAPRVVREPAASPVTTTPTVRPEPRRPEPRRSEARTAETDRQPRTSVAEPVAMAPPSPPAPPVRVGGNIKSPTKIRDVRPGYPAVAQASRVQGIVIIEATIGPDGRVRNTRVLRSIPLLDEAALDAVRQWEYEPTLLNGVAVPVIMTVTVQFRLQQ